ncbi:MAG: hypothetical protein EU552_01955 [Promethearchaeota archaeon]|nr:MAG: hypothetical protein EU552_01955 [Candidatus Lokiarchaeota archaeon]
MKKERLNKNFLDEFEYYAFSTIKENNIFLVGSSRFKDYFLKVESILQIIYKKQVYICSVDGLINKEYFSKEEWENLQTIALQKLHNHDAILVIDVNGYIGDHSREEIEYFENVIKKPIYYLSLLKN